MRTRVKICGITRVEDARAAADAGADAIGLVFDPDSPRCVTLEQALAIINSVPPFVTVVGLFVDSPVERVRAVLERARLGLVQFHGAETPEQCRLYGRPYVKAIRMRGGVNLHAEERRYADATGLVLDTYVPGQSGGSGRAFDWGLVPGDLHKPVILAGGLHADNVGDAIRRVRPAAVDVSSGVESAKGIKDPHKIAAFIRAVREAA
ncbi:N-(5'-phosphoribosyl)anthranilate isomerase [Sulfurifustis variabilis]|uniref:N-(5'-phosphoribosyl)anthranilate isomerase n=1 Tax=Sulfurifustis variabilis TaxID=1675686 RepID=A0A1B4VD34_9GAMM|nr:phosphoribosylanthranilate isomerase [Sulfurifustis variabilis]BAU47297.1 N-(5'-phosphoribosyl)anthranilate isomerase [Sulfurifustis variabilis]